MTSYLDFLGLSGHIWPVIKTATELARELADHLRVRRAAMNWPQEEAARRAGVTDRTWRRLETEGKGSLETLIKAAIALRCEEGLSALFPVPAATSIDDLLRQQAAAELPPARRRARRRRTP